MLLIHTIKLKVMKKLTGIIFALFLLMSCEKNIDPDAKIGDVWGLHSITYDSTGTVIFDSLIYYTGKEVIRNNESYVILVFDESEYNGSLPVYKYKSGGLYMYRPSYGSSPFKYLAHPGTVGDIENLSFGTSTIMATNEVVTESPLTPTCYKYQIDNSNGFRTIIWFHTDYWFVKMEEWAPNGGGYYLQSRVILESYASH